MKGYLGKVINKAIDEAPNYEVPANSDKNLVFFSDMDSCFAEQYRVLASKIVHTNKKKKMRKIGITSSVKGEGKTLTACNIAYTLSRSFSKKVCLLELDLKDPKIQLYWGGKKEIRLDEILYDYNLIGEAILKLFNGRLVVIPCGKGVPNHTNLLSSDRIESFLAGLEDVFDFIIIDTPPVVALADTQLIKSYLDGIIFVVKGDETPKVLVEKGLDVIRDKLTGIVLNGIDQMSYYGSKYKYTYTYLKK